MRHMLRLSMRWEFSKQCELTREVHHVIHASGWDFERSAVVHELKGLCFRRGAARVGLQGEKMSPNYLGDNVGFARPDQCGGAGAGLRRDIY